MWVSCWRGMEGLRGVLCLCSLLGISLLFGTVAAATNPADTAALKAFHNSIGNDPLSKLANWKGDDPCGNNWNGVLCGGNGVQYVEELHVLGFDLEGSLAPELGDLTNVTILDLMWNSISGSIPSTLGKLQNLQLLLLNGNKLTGQLPMELGRLTNMNRLQIDENQISGPIPPTFGNLSSVKHLHMNNNSLNGSIPPDLGRLPVLKHLLVDNNKLSGILPSELANISTLQIIQVDNNQFDPLPIPPAYANCSSLLKLSMRNCNLYGSVLDFSSLVNLEYLDLSSNHLYGMIPNGSIPVNLTTMILSNNVLTGPIPASFGNLPNLELLDFHNNNLSDIDPGVSAAIHNSSELRVYGNPKICDTPAPQDSKFCSPQNSNIEKGTNLTSSFALCKPDICQAGQGLLPTLAAQGNCQCAPVIRIDCRLKSPGFVSFDKYLQDFQSYMSKGLNLSVGQVTVESYNWGAGPRLHFVLAVFPSTTQTHLSFNYQEVKAIFLQFASWEIPDSPVYGPRELLVFITPNGIDLFPSGNAGRSRAAFAGIIIGSIAGTAILVGALMFFTLRRRASPSPSRKHLLSSTHNKELKIEGIRSFSLQEMEAATDNFSDKKLLGKGGFGTVYEGMLDIGEVAIKRAKDKDISEEGLTEFYTEIQLLSRVHHKNLVKLIGYCMDDGEQLLVYEYMAGGTLRDRLSSSERPLDLKTRLSIARGSAHGILYLHNAADPPIIHRDIKAANILLDEKNEAKVSDFGVSRLAPVPDLDGLLPDHVSTVVKGTPGYLDPEYFLTRQLTDKSDVYSFGVVLLEIFSGQHPIFNGKNLVREARMAYKKGDTISLLDPNIKNYASKETDQLLIVALSCCNDQPETRPSMAEVLRSLENIWHQYCGFNRHSNESSVVDIDSNYTEEQRAKIYASLTDTTTSTFSTESTTSSTSNRDSTSFTQKRNFGRSLSSR
ncbi:hypothetical protein O6H91_Y545400 [Diphasiastrum complanatum]|nr:hypothetical protein O6H91_Y545400 [Diphasiastrum complanatum]KAJ7298561.1 hypothetical protein O6H91_Y545400 [Diphasiastrum complanatum]